MSPYPAIIAGGGIAGLAVALSFGGRDGLVLERSETFSAAGAGLQLGPNAIRALQKLGAWDAVSATTSSPPEIHIRDGVTGKCLKRLALGPSFERRFGAPYCVAHRADVHRALLEVVKSRSNLSLRMAANVTRVDSVDGGIIAFGQRDLIRPVGAPSPRRREEGTTWRPVPSPTKLEKVDRAKPETDEVPWVNIGDRLVDDAGVMLQVGSEVLRGSQLWATDGVHSAIRQALVPGSAPIDSGARFHRALLAKVPDVKGVALECVNLWMFPGGHVVHYPVGTPKRLNVVAVVPDAITPALHFANACTSLRHIVSHLADASIWPGLYVNPLPTWQFGNITLLGDAAHGTLPYLAQGAAMALEDAAAVVGIAAESSFTDAIKQRQKRTALLHQKTLAAGQTYHLSGMLGAARNAAIALSPSVFLQNQLGWIYRNY